MAKINPYENAYNLAKQMVNESIRNKKYLTASEIKYIFKASDRSIQVYNDFHTNDECKELEGDGGDEK